MSEYTQTVDALLHNRLELLQSMHKNPVFRA